MAAPSGYRPGRVLAMLLLSVMALSVWAFWPGQSHVPRLGLDLQGGTQVILAPTPIEEGATLSEEQLKQTVEIIRQRVNGLGVAEAEVAVQGSGNTAAIVVSVPGITQDRIVDLVGQTALLNFRPVQAILAPGPTDLEGNPIVEQAPAPEAGEPPADEGATDEGAMDEGATDEGATDEGATDEGATDEGAADEGATIGRATIVQAPDLSADFQAQLLALDCTDPVNMAGGSPDNPTLYLGTCDSNGTAKYVLQPAFIRGTNIDDAQAQLPTQGIGSWVVTLEFDDEGASQLAEVSTSLSAMSAPQNQFAIVLDGVVITAPSFSEPILGGSAQITGTFTASDAQDLANVLKFGALPLNLHVQAVESVSPTLGSDQLRAGIIAGIIGLILVAIYLLLYYRALGVIAVLSLLVAGVISYAMFVILGRTISFTLTLAGIAGAIVAIGITADSFVVYFERLRDEVRDGRSLRQAADSGWLRARRTLLAADFVSFLAAMVLYWLSIGNVRGFAFALGLTTVVDVIVAFLFTRPLVALLCRTKWMSRGGIMTGVAPDRLGGATTLEGKHREKGAPRRAPGPAMASTAPDRED